MQFLRKQDLNSDEEGGRRRETVYQVARLGTQVLSEFEDDEQRTMRSRGGPQSPACGA